MLNIQGKPIHYVTKSPILGVIIDSNLTWRYQVNKVISSAWLKWSNIKKLTHSNWGINTNTILDLVKISVLPTIQYAGIIWLNYAHLQFDSLVYDILKTCLGVKFHPSRLKMESILGWITIEYLVIKHAVKFIIKNLYSTSSNDPFKNTFMQFLRSSSIINSSFISSHVNSVKNFINYVLGYRRSHRYLNLLSIESIPYNQNSFSVFTQNLNVSSLNNRYQLDGISQSLPFMDVCPNFTNHHIESTFYSFVLNCGFYRSNLARMGYSHSSACPFCYNYDTAYHIMFECPNLRSTYSVNIISGLMSYNLDINCYNLMQLICLNPDFVHDIDCHINYIISRRNDL